MRQISPSTAKKRLLALLASRTARTILINAAPVLSEDILFQARKSIVALSWGRKPKPIPTPEDAVAEIMRKRENTRLRVRAHRERKRLKAVTRNNAPVT